VGAILGIVVGSVVVVGVAAAYFTGMLTSSVVAGSTAAVFTDHPNVVYQIMEGSIF
jgi:hypothetical protein